LKLGAEIGNLNDEKQSWVFHSKTMEKSLKFWWTYMKNGGFELGQSGVDPLFEWFHKYIYIYTYIYVCVCFFYQP
jgi:hypothetical protein